MVGERNPECGSGNARWPLLVQFRLAAGIIDRWPIPPAQSQKMHRKGNKWYDDDDLDYEVRVSGQWMARRLQRCVPGTPPLSCPSHASRGSRKTTTTTTMMNLDLLLSRNQSEGVV